MSPIFLSTLYSFSNKTYRESIKPFIFFFFVIIVPSSELNTNIISIKLSHNTFRIVE